VDTGVGRINSLIPMGSTVWSCGMDKNIHLWDVHNMQLVRSLQGHTSYINGLVKVKRTETRVLWSYSMGDKKLNVWKMEKVGEDDSADQLSQLQAAYATLDEHINNLKSRLADEEAKRKAAEAMQQQIRDAALLEVTSLVERLSKAQIALEDKDIELEMALKERDKFKAENERLKPLAAQVPKLEREIEELKAALDRQKQHYEGQLQPLKDQLDEANKKNQKQADEIDELRKRLAEFERLFANGGMEKDALLARIKALEEALAKMTARSDALAEDVVNLKSSNKKLKESNATKDAKIAELEAEIARLKAREEELLKQIEALDAFKLDEIARAMKKVEQQLERTKGGAHDILNHAKTLSNPADKESTGDYARWLMDALEESRNLVKTTIEQCLSELQKYHIGSTTKERA